MALAQTVSLIGIRTAPSCPLPCPASLHAIVGELPNVYTWWCPSWALLLWMVPTTLGINSKSLKWFSRPWVVWLQITLCLVLEPHIVLIFSCSPIFLSSRNALSHLYLPHSASSWKSRLRWYKLGDWRSFFKKSCFFFLESTLAILTSHKHKS